MRNAEVQNTVIKILIISYTRFLHARVKGVYRVQSATKRPIGWSKGQTLYAFFYLENQIILLIISIRWKNFVVLTGLCSESNGVWSDKYLEYQDGQTAWHSTTIRLYFTKLIQLRYNNTPGRHDNNTKTQVQWNLKVPWP